MQNRFKNIKLSFVIMLTTIIVWFAADCAVFGLGKMGVEVGESARFGAQARAAEYYVDQNHSSASDSNSGTEDLPWLTYYKNFINILLMPKGVFLNFRFKFKLNLNLRYNS